MLFPWGLAITLILFNRFLPVDLRKMIASCFFSNKIGTGNTYIGSAEKVFKVSDARRQGEIV